MLPQPGQTFEGKYLVEEHIGSGGFAEVYRASDSQGRKVAIKLLVPTGQEWAATDKLITRFEREGELLGRLTNEHTVQMIDMGRTANNNPYIIFEFVDGTDLAEVVEKMGALPPERVVTILQQVCSALQEAHDLGVMHRDIKPANIMIYQHLGISGLVKLLDFGIAKPTTDDDNQATGSSLTTAGMVLGTPRYMAPEQFTGSRPTPASDIYSLGLVAYELLTGVPAVDAETSTGVFRQQLTREAFKMPKSANVPSSLRKVIEKMIAKDRKNRYQTMGEVLDDLEKLGNLKGGGSNTDEILQYVALAAVIALIVGAGWKLLGDSDGQPDPQSSNDVVATNEAPPTPDPPPDDPPKTAQNEVEPDPEPEKKPEADDPPDEPAEPKGDEETPEGTGAPVVPPDEPPPPDDIEPLELKTMAEAKAVASSSYTMANWDRVIAACKPYGATQTFCTRMLAEAYKNKGDVKRACYWFEVLGDVKHGLDCQ